ncbi:MAG: response regulator transcription factor [Eubacteriales bacterium]|nr:response regulator transcription factor [Eubacteriales bacterium]
MSYKILIAEDDAGLNEGIRLALKQNDIVFVPAYTLQEAWEFFEAEHPKMVLLDINFPDGNGFDFLWRMRQVSDIPVLVITANDMELDEVKGLTLGADDYITKPFSLMALRARVENIRRRTAKTGAFLYEKNGCRFDFERLDFRVNGQEITLSAAEQKLLRLFVTHPGQTLQRNVLVEHIWIDGMEYVDENALSVTVSRLRRKLEIKGKDSPIGTVYGIGYVWNM